MLTEPNGLIIKLSVYTGVLDDLGGACCKHNITSYVGEIKQWSFHLYG